MKHHLRVYSTSSALSRLAKCPPSATLEPIGYENDAANEGTAGHEHYEDRHALGVDEAMRRLPELARKYFGLNEREATFFIARMRKLEWCPPKGSFGEVSLCMFEDGRVERTAGGKGHYPDLEPGGKHEGAFVAGQIDGLWSEPEPLDLTDPDHPKCPPGSILWVVDSKFGVEAYVEPVETNLQLANNAVMAAKWTGAKHVVPAIIFMNPPQGDWDVPTRDGAPFAWGARELADAEARVRAVHTRKMVALTKAAAGAPVEGYTEGAWCKFCPGRNSCPARVASMREVAGRAMVPRKRGEGITLTADEVQWWAMRLGSMKSFLERVEAYMQDHVDATGQPIDLGNGLMWGKKPTSKEKIIPHVALPLLLAEFGEDNLDGLVTLSKSGIEELVKLDPEKGKRGKRAGTMRRILAAIKEADGFRKEVGISYGAHRAGAGVESNDEDEMLGEVVSGGEAAQ